MDTAPGSNWVIVAGDRDIGFGRQDPFERIGETFFEDVSCQPLHFRLDRFERLPFTLADFDREELEEVPIVIGGGRSGAIWPIDQTGGDIKPD